MKKILLNFFFILPSRSLPVLFWLLYLHPKICPEFCKNCHFLPPEMPFSIILFGLCLLRCAHHFDQLNVNSSSFSYEEILSICLTANCFSGFRLLLLNSRSCHCNEVNKRTECSYFRKNFPKSDYFTLSEYGFFFVNTLCWLILLFDWF